MKDKKYFIIILPFFLILLFFLFKSFTMVKMEYSIEESRDLKLWKNIDFKNLENTTADIEDYLVDQFPYRRDFLKAFSEKDKFLNKIFTRSIYVLDDNWLFAEASGESMDYVSKELDRVLEKYPNKEFFYAIVPSKNLALKDRYKITKNDIAIKNYKSLKNNLEKINNDNFSIIDLIPISTEKSFLNDDSKWYRTDFHWNALGAKIATDFILNSLKDNNIIDSIYSEDNIEIKYIEDKLYRGDLNRRFSYIYGIDDIPVYMDLKNTDGYSYFKTEDNSFKVNRNEIISTGLDNEFLDYSTLYTPNLPYYRVENINAINDKSILIIKDSMQNAAIDLFTETFKETKVIDPRFDQEYSLDKIINSTDIVLFFFHQNNNSKATGEYFNKNLNNN